MKHRKLLLVFLAIVVFSTVCLFVGNWYLSGKFEKVVREKLAQEVEVKSQGLYRLDIQKIEVKLLREQLQLKDICLTVDSLRAPIHADISIKAVKIRMKRLLRSYFKKQAFDVTWLSIDEPHIFISKNEPKKTAKNNDIPVFHVSHQPSFFHGVILDQCLVNNGSLCLLQKKDSLIVNDFSLDFQALLLDTSLQLTEELPTFDRATVNIASLTYPMSKAHYTIKATDLTVDLGDSSLSLSNLDVIPMHSKATFAYQAHVQNRIDAKLEQLSIKNIQWTKLLSEKSFFADSLLLGSFDIYSYKNKHAPSENKIKPLFHRALQKLPIKLDIPYVHASGNAVFELLPAKGDETGQLSFDRISCTIKDLTNIARSNDQVFEVYADLAIMNQGRVDLICSFPVHPKNPTHKVSGTVENMSFPKFNSMIEPVAHIELISGNVSKISLEMIGNDSTAKVDMTMLYDNLDIRLQQEHLRMKGMLSFLINNLILHNENPNHHGKVREIKHAVGVRDPYRSHFYFWWATLFSGIKETVGFSEHLQEDLQDIEREIFKLKHHHKKHKEE